MATYTSQLAHSVTHGSGYIFTLPAITIPASERFYRCKIEKSGLNIGRCYMAGNAESVLGSQGFNVWTTNPVAISWTNGAQPKVNIKNSGEETRTWTIKVTIETEIIPDFTITCSSGTGGTLTANKSKAAAGTTITLTPKASSGYELNTLTASPSVSISSANKFTMPAANITITATWKKISYALTKQTNPTGAGTVSLKRNGSEVSTGQKDQTINASQVPAAGYYFNGWTVSPASVTINGSGNFTMPAAAVTVTANYLKRSTASINKGTLIGGDTAALTINADKATYSHKYQLSFGSGMETELTDVAAGVSMVEIEIPEEWAEEIPDEVYQTGGTLTVETYSGTTKIGEYVIQGLQYMVPETAVPEISEILTEIVRTIGGVTYANVGDYYVQSHCGVRVQTDAEGALGSTVESMMLTIGGYSGNEYSDMVLDDEIDFTSGLLTNAGQTSISVTVYDSRGRSSTATAVITVTGYTAPEGTADAWRVDALGDEDDMGTYGKYAMTTRFSQIGTNALTVTLGCQGSTVTPQADTGDLLPGNRLTFSLQQEYTVTLTLADAFETTVITTKLPSAKFIIYVAADGARMAFFKASTKQVPAGMDSVMEFSADTQIYIGDETLEAYIRRIATS